MVGLIVSLGTLFGALLTAIGVYFRDRAQGRKSDAEANTMMFKAGFESHEALARSAAGHVATADALLNRVVAQLTAANDKLDAQEATIAALREQVNNLTARLVAAGLVT